jgi:hypothetical protein
VYRQVMQNCLVQGLVKPVLLFFLFTPIFAAIFEPALHEMARRICLNVFRGGKCNENPSDHGHESRFLILG